MPSGLRETWNHDYRTLLRNTRDSLVPPLAHRVAAFDFGDSQHLGESGIAQTTMPDTPSPRGPPNIPARIAPHVLAIHGATGRGVGRLKLRSVT